MSRKTSQNDETYIKDAYRPFCSSEEITRIVDVKDTHDYLLKIRANAVVDNMRIFRVMLKRVRYDPENWNFTGHFSEIEFNSYIQHLSDEDRKRCEDIARGYIFSNNPNGACMRTSYGDLIVVSESLRYFLYYMNLCFLDWNYDVPTSVRLCALRIAIRTMLQVETMDFELDPRGEMPPALNHQIIQKVSEQLEFIIGHEYAHHLLSHLDANSLYDQPLFINMGEEINHQTHTFYNYRQKQELEADEAAIFLPNFSDDKMMSYAFSAISFFIYLDIYQQASDQIFPANPQFSTHPKPLDRMWNIVKKIGKYEDTYIEKFLEAAATWKRLLEKDVAYNIDNYEIYGSVYLAEWRGSKLKDRVDY